MRYVEARLTEYQREEAYRTYVTNSLQLIPQSKYLQKTYAEVIKPVPVDNRPQDVIVTDIMKRAGLKFGG